MDRSVIKRGGAAGAVAARARGIPGRLWQRGTAKALRNLHGRAQAARLHAAAAGPPIASYDPSQIEGLPAPVARYFTFALKPGQPLVERARLVQRGTFATARERWAPFWATEDFTVAPPGFVWDARIRVAPLVAAHVRDSYIAGEGVMHGALAGLLTVVKQRGTPQMAAASLLRYLAEAAWLPPALLPSAGVRWDPLDGASARATLADAGISVSMDVRFAAGGAIESFSALRHRDVKGRPELTPWSGRFSGYERVQGMMVPTEGEVGWDLPEGRFAYWRGRTVDAEFQPVAG